MDRLAASGVLFRHAYTPVSSCSPSRACIMTGLYQHTNGQYGLAHGVHNQQTMLTALTLPKLFRDAGYATGLIGKKHVRPQEQYPFETEIKGAQEDGEAAPNAPELALNRDVHQMALKAREFFAKNHDRPFMLLVGWGDPHRGAGDNGDGFANKHYEGVPAVPYDPAKVEVPFFLNDYPGVRQDLAEYYESISRMDHGVGLVLDELKASGRADDTLVICTSDHGMPFPCIAKTNQYEPALQVPLIIASPESAKRGIVNNALVSHVDLLPTLLAWAGIRLPKDYAPLPGRSLLPILNQEEPRGFNEVYGSHTLHEITMFYPMRSIRTRKYKYIVNVTPEMPYPMGLDVLDGKAWKAIVAEKPKELGGRPMKELFHRPVEELFDLRKDPEEKQNVAADPAYGAVLKEMRRKMDEFRAATKDTWRGEAWRKGAELADTVT
jgi:N-sulfoglucosamine sulfohydrolase